MLMVKSIKCFMLLFLSLERREVLLQDLLQVQETLVKLWHLYRLARLKLFKIFLKLLQVLLKVRARAEEVGEGLLGGVPLLN